jgi:hypothetical protein
MRTRRVSGAVLAALLIAAGGALGSAAQGSAATCRSGKTLFHSGHVRAFSVKRIYHDRTVGNSPFYDVYVCRPGRAKPQRIYETSPYNYFTPSNFRLFGARLGFQLYELGYGNGSQTTLGWVDVQSGVVRIGAINDGENAGPGDPLVPDDAVSYAIAPDGAVALIGGKSSEPQRVAELPIGPRAFGKLKVIFDAPGGGLDRGSIAIDAATISWRTKVGAAASAPR